MAQTFQEALATATADCSTTADRLKRIKVILDATEEAMFNAAIGGAVKSYKVNTGQTVIDVEASDLAQLKRQHRDLFALYNELCGIYSGSNVMVIRDGSTQGR